MSSGSTRLGSQSPPSPTADLVAVGALPTLSTATRLFSSVASGDNTKTVQHIAGLSSQTSTNRAREFQLPRESKMSSDQEMLDAVRGTDLDGKRSTRGLASGGGDRLSDVLSTPASFGSDSGIGTSAVSTPLVSSAKEHLQNVSDTGSVVPKIPLEPIVQLKKYTSNDFKFIKTLGDGSFATVYLAKEIGTNRSWAIKVCEKRQIIREKRGAYIKREREVLQMLNANPSPFFVNLFCTFQDESRLYYVLTYARNGELLTYIIKVNCFDAACTQFYTAEVILALEHLHSLGIIHRDIKVNFSFTHRNNFGWLRTQRCFL